MTVGLRGALAAALVIGAAACRPAVQRNPYRADDVALRCSPTDAEVWLDGVPQGRCSDFSGAPKGLAVGAGMHKIEVRKDGYQSYETYLQADGTRAVLNVTLSSLGDS